MYRKVVYFQVLAARKMGDSCLKEFSWDDGGLTSQSPFPLLTGGRGFYKEGEGNRAKRSREGVEKFSTC